MVDHKAAKHIAENGSAQQFVRHAEKVSDAYLDLRRLVKEYFKQVDDDTMNSDCRAAESALRAAIEQGD